MCFNDIKTSINTGVSQIYEGVLKKFRTDAVKIIKLTISSIGRHDPRSCYLPHVDTGPPSPPFLERFLEVQAFSAIRPGSVQWYQTGVLSAYISFLEIGRIHRVHKSGEYGGWGWQPFIITPETAGWGRKCETGRCHGEAARSLLAKVGGDVFALFHAVAAKRRRRTRNSQFGLLGAVFRATTTNV
jgi:hypothetical protein